MQGLGLVRCREPRAWGRKVHCATPRTYCRRIYTRTARIWIFVAS
jgi:hypothetical protein